MRIQIAGYLAASDLLKREPGQWDALVMLDSRAEETSFVSRMTLRHHFLWFDDIEQPVTGKQLATSEMIAAGLRFAEGSTRLLVSCRAGQSRSVAVAYLIACQQLGIDAALALLNPTRHVPNRHVVHLGANVLQDPEIEAAFEGWQRKHADTCLADYYNEIESEIAALETAGVVNQITMS